MARALPESLGVVRDFRDDGGPAASFFGAERGDAQRCAGGDVGELIEGAEGGLGRDGSWAVGGRWGRWEHYWAVMMGC
jgi:hypothetical protein